MNRRIQASFLRVSAIIYLEVVSVVFGQYSDCSRQSLQTCAAGFNSLWDKMMHQRYTTREEFTRLCKSYTDMKSGCIDEILPHCTTEKTVEMIKRLDTYRLLCGDNFEVFLRNNECILDRQIQNTSKTECLQEMKATLLEVILTVNAQLKIQPSSHNTTSGEQWAWLDKLSPEMKDHVSNKLCGLYVSTGQCLVIRTKKMCGEEAAKIYKLFNLKELKRKIGKMPWCSQEIFDLKVQQAIEQAEDIAFDNCREYTVYKCAKFLQQVERMNLANYEPACNLYNVTRDGCLNEILPHCQDNSVPRRMARVFSLMCSGNVRSALDKLEECIYTDTLKSTDQECTDRFKTQAGNIEGYDQYDLQNQLCQLANNIFHCVATRIKRTCNQAAADFYLYLYSETLMKSKLDRVSPGLVCNIVDETGEPPSLPAFKPQRSVGGRLMVNAALIITIALTLISEQIIK